MSEKSYNRNKGGKTLTNQRICLHFERQTNQIA